MALRSAVLIETGRAEEGYAYLHDVLAGRSDDAELRFFESYALTYAGFLAAFGERFGLVVN